MSRAAPMPRRPAKTKAVPKGFLPDRIAGGVAILLDGAAVVVALSVLHGRLSPGCTLDFAVLALNLVAHVGVFRGARWGFFLTAALAAWGLFGLGVPRGAHLLFSTNLWMLLYAVFRLGSVYGPEAR